MQGKHVWGYHCVSPTPNAYLNSFVDVPVMKQRLIPWLGKKKRHFRAAFYAKNDRFTKTGSGQP